MHQRQTGTVQSVLASLQCDEQSICLLCSEGFQAAWHSCVPLSFALSSQFKKTQNSRRSCQMSPAFIWNHAKHQGSLISIKIKSRLAQKGLDLTFIEAMKFSCCFSDKLGLP